MNKTEGQMLTELFMRDMKCEPLEQTARYWVGQSNQEYTQGKGSGKRFSLTLDQGHEGSLREERRGTIFFTENYCLMSQ